MSNQMFDLHGKKALVVGGHGGIGKAIALGLADAGADVAVASRNLEALKNVAKEIEAKGCRSLAVSVDIVDEKQVNEMVAQVLQAFTRIDILVNAAGLAIRKPADSFPIDEWQKVMDINTRGTFLCCQAVGRVMLKQKSGRIINLSSVRGRYGLPSGYAAYCPSKGAVDTLTRTLACEWAKYNINVNAVAPGYIETEMVSNLVSQGKLNVEELKTRTPSGVLTSAEDVAEAVVFLASESSRSINGETIIIDGGWTAYGYLESWLARNRF